MTPFTSSRTNSKPRFPFLSHVFSTFLILCPMQTRYWLFTWSFLMMEKTCRDFLKEFSRARWYRRTYGSYRMDNVNFFQSCWRAKSEIRCWIVVIVLLLLIWSGWNDLFVCWWSQWDCSVIRGRVISVSNHGHEPAYEAWKSISIRQYHRMMRSTPFIPRNLFPT